MNLSEERISTYVKTENEKDPSLKTLFCALMSRESCLTAAKLRCATLKIFSDKKNLN